MAGTHYASSLIGGSAEYVLRLRPVFGSLTKIAWKAYTWQRPSINSVQRPRMHNQGWDSGDRPRRWSTRPLSRVSFVSFLIEILYLASTKSLAYSSRVTTAVRLSGWISVFNPRVLPHLLLPYGWWRMRDQETGSSVNPWRESLMKRLLYVYAKMSFLKGKSLFTIVYSANENFSVDITFELEKWIH